MFDALPGWGFPASLLVFLLGCLFGPVLVTCLWEKRLVWPYTRVPEPNRDPPPLTRAME